MLFHNLISNALNIANQFHLEFIDGGISDTLTCVSIQGQGYSAIGTALTPQNEGDLTPFKADSIENLLLQGDAYDAGKRSIALATINAIGQWYLQKKPPLCQPNLRMALSEQILKLTCKDSKIVFIGHLKPVVSALRQNGRNPIVFCRQQTDIQNQVYNDIYEYEGILDANVIIITGAALIGSTIDALLAISPKNAHIILAGFSAGLYPQWLQDTHINQVASINLSDVSLDTLLSYKVEDIFAHPCYIQSTKC